MRRLTFEGFLDSYVRHLSGADTRSLARLLSLLPTNPRLGEPLVLWAVVTGRDRRLRASTDLKPALRADLEALSLLQARGLLEAALGSADPRLRPGYTKTWNSYVSRRDAPDRDARLKLEARSRVLELQGEKHVSQYRMAKDLGLNPGNLNAFLVQGDPRKLGLANAVRLVKYVDALTPSAV